MLSKYKRNSSQLTALEGKTKMSSSSDGHSTKPDDLIKFATDIVAAYVSNNPTPISEIPGMIKSIHATWAVSLVRRARTCRRRKNLP